MMDWIDNLLPLIGDTGFRLNIIAEFIGVLLSIPLSIWIASRLDRRVERRRRKSALSAVVRMSQHELHYFSRRYLREITSEVSGASQAIVFYRRTKQVSVNAESAIRDIISNAQAQIGGDITSELLQILFRLRYQWRSFTEFIVFEDAYFTDLETYRHDPDEAVNARLDAIINIFGWIHERNAEVALQVDHRFGRSIRDDPPKPDIDALRFLLTKIHSHRLGKKE